MKKACDNIYVLSLKSVEINMELAWRLYMRILYANWWVMSERLVLLFRYPDTVLYRLNKS